jgi:putative phosphoribosyl transferase
MQFADRTEAGRQLAGRLVHLRGQPAVALGLPRGGVPVAAEVARAIGAPLDVIVVRKLGVPFQPELAMGAVGEEGARVIDAEVVRLARVSAEDLSAIETRERSEVDRRARSYRAGRDRVPLTGRIAVIVDDGIATGATARAACQVVLATPVAPPDWQHRIGSGADDMVSVATPMPFFAIGEFYDDFSQTTDEAVVACLTQQAGAAPS